MNDNAETDFCPYGKGDNIEESAWYYNPWIIAAAIFFTGPLGLLPLWFKPNTGLKFKIVVSAIVIAVAALFALETVEYYNTLIGHYKEIKRSA